MACWARGWSGARGLTCTCRGTGTRHRRSGPSRLSSEQLVSECVCMYQGMQTCPQVMCSCACIQVYVCLHMRTQQGTASMRLFSTWHQVHGSRVYMRLFCSHACFQSQQQAGCAGTPHIVHASQNLSGTPHAWLLVITYTKTPMLASAKWTILAYNFHCVSLNLSMHAELFVYIKDRTSIWGFLSWLHGIHTCMHTCEETHHPDIHPCPCGRSRSCHFWMTRT
jgi:hypothetical protein